MSVGLAPQEGRDLDPVLILLLVLVHHRGRLVGLHRRLHHFRMEAMVQQ